MSDNNHTLYEIVDDISDVVNSILFPSLSSIVIHKSNKDDSNKNDSNDSISIVTTSYRFLIETKCLSNPGNNINNQLSLAIRNLWSHMIISSNKSYSNWHWMHFTSRLITNGINLYSI